VSGATAENAPGVGFYFNQCKMRKSLFIAALFRHI
jgi:hypothetical protein